MLLLQFPLIPRNVFKLTWKNQVIRDVWGACGPPYHHLRRCPRSRVSPEPQVPVRDGRPSALCTQLHEGMLG